MMRRIFWGLMLLYCASAVGQYKKPYFHSLNVANGLPEAFVQSSLQDKYGYIWLGTQNGLVRYDGYKMKPYTIVDDRGQELVNTSIRYLYEDKQGKLWVHIGNEGFYFYDRSRDKFLRKQWMDAVTDSIVNNASGAFYWAEGEQPGDYIVGIQQFTGNIAFKVFYFNDAKNSLEEYSSAAKGKHFIPAYTTIDIRQDATGKIWMVADSLLCRFDAGTKSFTPWFVLPDNKQGDLFESFQPDPVDTAVLWMNTYAKAFGSRQHLATVAMKLVQFNTRTKQYKIFLPDSTKAGALPANALQVYTDSLKRVFVSTKKGLSLFNRQTGSFINYAIPFSFVASSIALAADKEGSLWLGGDALALYYLNTNSGVLTEYKGQKGVGDLQMVSGINKIFYDRFGVLWVSTPFAGIHYLDRQQSLFAPMPIRYSAKPGSEKMRPSSYTIADSRDDSICFLRDTTSLWAWHSNTDKYDQIDLKNKDAYRRIQYVLRDKDGSLWIATYGLGLYYYNAATRAVINYRNNSKDSLSLSTNYLGCLAMGSDGLLWIGTNNKGLCSFNKQTKKFTQYPFIVNDGSIMPNNKLDDQTVLSMLFDEDGILWIGTNLGALNRFEPASATFSSYLDKKKGFTCVASVYEDSHKRLWVGTYLSGLFLFDRKTGAFKRYSEKDGLLGNNTQSITEDAAGNIWSFNERGMSRLNPANNAITNFTDFRIIGREFNNYKDDKGDFHFSITDGMVSFDPLKLNDNKIPPAVIIESVSYPAANSKTDTTLFVEGREEVTLAYNENKISFQFVALHFANAPHNKYAYQLAGVDNNWIQAGTERTATYANLSPGTYIFKVKAASSDGVWNETGAGFTVIILSPWWKTWWAYCLYALLVGGAAWSYIQYRSRTLRRENAALEEKVNDRTRQLQQSLTDLKATQVQLVQSEKMASLGELTAGIAHEIQNPLNFVNNFSEINTELIDELKSQRSKLNSQEVDDLLNDIAANEEKINHHGKRADAIVKGMLQHSRVSSGQKEPADINALCDEYLKLSYHGYRAKDKSFNANMQTNFDETIGKINMVPQDIGRVLLNLFNNAFYAVNERYKAEGERYKPLVAISTSPISSPSGGRGVTIKVSDNGVGIDPAIIDKIFQPFFTTKPTGQGTGLGLSLSYDIIKAHGGQLLAESKEGEGTIFIIQLPVHI